MKKQAQVVMLFAGKAENFLCLKDGKLKYQEGYLTQDYLNYSLYAKSFHLYIVSNDIIEKDDFALNPNGNIYKVKSTHEKEEILKFGNDFKIATHKCKKVIATNDKTVKYPERFPNFITSPQIQQQFIELFITEYNKGNIITEVEVEYEEYLDTTHSDHGAYKTKILINKDNTINISLPVKNDIKEFVNINYSFFTEDTRNKMILGINDYLKQNK